MADEPKCQLCGGAMWPDDVVVCATCSDYLDEKYAPLTNALTDFATSLDPDELDVMGKADCPKCGGAGWLWWHELDEYDGPAVKTGTDDTRYSCDHECHR